MTQKFSIGQNVVWPSGSGEATGKVEDYLTAATTVDGQIVDASEDDPRYLVKNDSTGKVTGHKPETLSAPNQNKVSDDHAANHQSSNPQGDAGDRCQPGDQVTWNTAQGETVGTVIEKLTSRTSIKGHTADASEEEPQYLVESDKTGQRAAPQPESLSEA